MRPVRCASPQSSHKAGASPGNVCNLARTTRARSLAGFAATPASRTAGTQHRAADAGDVRPHPERPQVVRRDGAGDDEARPRVRRRHGRTLVRVWPLRDRRRTRERRTHPVDHLVRLERVEEVPRSKVVCAPRRIGRPRRRVGEPREVASLVVQRLHEVEPVDVGQSHVDDETVAAP